MCAVWVCQRSYTAAIDVTSWIRCAGGHNKKNSREEGRVGNRVRHSSGQMEVGALTADNNILEDAVVIV